MEPETTTPEGTDETPVGMPMEEGTPAAEAMPMGEEAPTEATQ